MSSDDATPSAPGDQSGDSNEQAVELIRAKISKFYSEEPSAREEAAEANTASATHQPSSKHQQFMQELSASGKSLAQIQTEWHNYYVNLPDNEKHEVWQEFYANHAKLTAQGTRQSESKAAENTSKAPEVSHTAVEPREPSRPKPKTADIKQQLLKTVSDRANISTKRKHQLKSLGFGLSMGFLVVFILLFSFFNERFIAPLITPSRQVSSTPIITDITDTQNVSTNPVIIIPKINIEIPVVYDEPTIDDGAVQRALEKGVLHYPTTSNPGEQGNAVFFGHSSSNILNNGKYKFAFVLLNRLENGDTFMIQKDGKRYVYRVYDRKIVKPTDVSVLDNRDRPTATLITCDPPGTAVNRLVVVGEQISPDPAINVASTATPTTAEPAILPSDSPTLWHRLWSWITS